MIRTGDLRNTSGARAACVLLAVSALCAAGESAARRAVVEVDRMQTPVGALQQVQVELSWPVGAEQGELEMRAGVVRAPGLGYAFEGLHWRCTVQRTGGDGDGFACAGDASAQGHGSGRLRLAFADGAMDARLSRGQARLSTRLGGDRIPVELQSVPVDWLGPLLAAAWAEATLTGGRVDASLSVDPDADDRTRIEGSVAAHGLGLDTRDGRIAAASLGLQGELALVLGDRVQATSTLSLQGGELLAGPMYVALPQSPIAVDLEVAGGDGLWQVASLKWRDGAVLRLEASATLRPDADTWLQSAGVQAHSDDLASANARYLGSLLGTLGLPDPTLSGGLSLDFAIDDGRPTRLSAQPRSATITDGQGRFAFAGLSGSLEWTRAAQARESRLSWDSASLHGIALGATALPLRSADGNLALTGAAALPLLGGTLRLQRLQWTPAFASDGAATAELALELEGADLAALSRALDWPEFGGEIGGSIPAARYRDGVLSFDGDLQVRVFDGTATIGSLSMERPFGVAPTLSGDIAMADLDLEPMTAAFGFGSITGRMDGHIRGLRLVDWEPVAFDAQLRTDAASSGQRRISQRAVQDLSNVGGAGIGGGLQAGLMGMFDTFPYEAIGLSCRLENNVCHMGGIEPQDAGYVIVRGRGLPRITVIGHQRRVDWPVLVARLQAATQGRAPVVQ